VAELLVAVDVETDDHPDRCRPVDPFGEQVVFADAVAEREGEGLHVAECRRGRARESLSTGGCPHCAP